MSPPAEKGYQKYAWIILFIFGLLWIVAAPINLSGTPPNPPSPEGTTGLSLDQMEARIPGLLSYISSISRQMGNFMLALGVLIMSTAAVPYRKGEKWAWTICWILPVSLVIQLVNSRGSSGWQADFAFIFVLLAGLFMPIRKFFPKQQAAAQRLGNDTAVR
jgi:hypothetical protein